MVPLDVTRQLVGVLQIRLVGRNEQLVALYEVLPQAASRVRHGGHSRCRQVCVPDDDGNYEPD